MDRTPARASSGKTLSSRRITPLKPKSGLNGPPAACEVLDGSWFFTPLSPMSKLLYHSPAASHPARNNRQSSVVAHRESASSFCLPSLRACVSVFRSEEHTSELQSL